MNARKRISVGPCGGGARLGGTEAGGRYSIDDAEIAGANSVLFQCGFEAIVSLVHIKLELSRLLLIKLLGCSHLIQGDQPLNDLAFVLKLLVCDLIDRLDDLHQQRVECVLLDKTNLDGIEESDEGFGRIDNEGRVGEVALLCCCARGALFDCDGYAYAQSLGRSWTIQLSTLLALRMTCPSLEL